MRLRLIALIGVVLAFVAPAAALAQAWTTPVQVSTLGEDGFQPQLAVDSGGGVTAAWIASDGLSATIQASRLSGGVWSAPVILSDPANISLYPVVAAGAAGYVVVVWIEDISGESRVQAARLQSGVWSSPVTLSAAGENASNARVVLNGAIATALWDRTDGADRIVQTSSSAGGAWTAPVNLSAAGGVAEESQLAVDPTGVVTAVWRRAVGPAQPVIQTSRLSGGVWSVPIVISGAFGGIRPQVTADSSGVATAVWESFNGADLVVDSARFSGGAWSAPVTLSSPGSDCTEPGAAVDGGGVATAIWLQELAGGDYVIQAARFASGTWGAPVSLSVPSPDACAPDVAANFSESTAVWYRDNGIRTVIQASRFVGGSWLAPVDLSDGTEDGNIAQVVIDANGVSTVVWQSSAGASARIMAVRFDPLLVPAPVPLMDDLWKIAFALMLAGGAVVLVRRRSVPA